MLEGLDTARGLGNQTRLWGFRVEGVSGFGQPASACSGPYSKGTTVESIGKP